LKNPDGGRSGEFFFFSGDNKIILKTITYQEFITFRNIIPSYFAYILNNNTMISLIYGLFRFVENNVPFYLIMQRNVA